MAQAFEREAESLRIGHLTYYILKLIDGLPKVGMSPYYALLAQELESKTRLGAGRSLLFSRLKSLAEGRKLLLSLEKERGRIVESLKVYR